MPWPFKSSKKRREGLDRPRLLAETNGPTKAFETELPNTLWIADIMDGPTLRLQERVLPTFLFATLDGALVRVPARLLRSSRAPACLQKEMLTNFP